MAKNKITIVLANTLQFNIQRRNDTCIMDELTRVDGIIYCASRRSRCGLVADLYIYEYIYIKWGGEDDTWSSTNILLLLFIVVRGACYYCGLFDEVDDDNDQYWVIRIDVVD